MVLRLTSGSVTPSSAPRNSPLGVAMHQPDVEAVAERRHHLLRLAGAQQAVVDEDAGELVADRLVDQHRRHRRIDAAGQAADHPALPDLGANRRAIAVGAEAGHRPVARQPRHLVGEIAQQLRAVRRVRPPRGGTSGRSSGAARRRSARRARSPRSPTTRNPGGRRVTRSPWLIHTCSRSPGFQTPSNSGLARSTSTSARPNSR